MSYQHMGAIRASDIAKVITGGAETVTLTNRILSDPHLNEAICEGMRVSNVLDNRPPGPRCARTPRVSAAALQKGVRLDRAAMAMRGFVFHKQNPWVLPTAVAGVLGLAYLLGYSAGKRRR